MVWTVPPPKDLDVPMEVIDFNIIFHDAEDAEVTKIFRFIDKKSKTLLGKYGTAKQSFRGDPKEIYVEISKTLLAKKEDFQNKWKAANHLFNKREAFTRADNAPFYNFINSFGMTPKRFAEKAGVENSVLFRYIKGQRQLSMDQAIKYAKAIGCDPVDLLFSKTQCRLWGSVDLFDVNEADQTYFTGQIMPAPTVTEGQPEKGLLSEQVINVPRDIYRPEIKAILINSLGSHLHNHFAYYYYTDSQAAIENKLVVVGRDIEELEDLGMDTRQYFFGILKIENGKQKLYNPEPTSEKRILCEGKFSFIAPVIALVKRGAMKVNYDYHESIEQSEQIKQALELQYKAQEALQKQMRELDISMQKLKELSKKEKMTLKEKLNLTELYKDLEEIPEFIKKKVG